MKVISFEKGKQDRIFKKKKNDNYGKVIISVAVSLKFQVCKRANEVFFFLNKII